VEEVSGKRSPVKGGIAWLRAIGTVRSTLKTRTEGSEGAPDAWVEVSPLVAQGLDGLVPGFPRRAIVRGLCLVAALTLRMHARFAPLPRDCDPRPLPSSPMTTR
jgi:hypothetical protein